MRARLLTLAIAVGITGLLAPGADAGSAGNLQREIDLKVWSSPARNAVSAAAETALAVRLGLVSMPTSPPATPGSLAAGDGAGANVRVNDTLGDLHTPCTTQSETTLVALGPSIAVGFNDSGDGCAGALNSYTGFGYSTDGGATFADGGKMVPPDGGASWGDPSMALGRRGPIYFATLGDEAGGVPNPTGLLTGRGYLPVHHSHDGGKTWSAPVDGTSGLNGFHDKELITVDDTGGPHDGNLYLVWTDFSGGQGKGVIRFSRSTDLGESFSTPIQLSKNDGDYDIGAYPTVGPNGELYVVWQIQLTQSPAVYFTASLDGGQTFSFPRKIRTVKAAGHPLSTCSRQGMKGEIRMLIWPVAAVDRTPITDPGDPPPHRGTIYVAYAAKTGTDEGDIYVIRSTNGGATWDPPSPSPGIKVNDDATTRDQFMPAIAGKSNGEVALLWYDRRADASNTMIEAYAARSLDGGETWGANLKVSDAAFEGVGNNTFRDPGVAGCYMGDYNQMIPFGGGYAAAWGDNRDRYPASQASSRSDPNVYFGSFGF